MRLKKTACIETLYLEIPFLDRFAAAKRDGFDSVEFWNWENKDLDEVEKASKEAGIEIAGFSGDDEYSLVDPTQKSVYLDFFSKSLKVAKRLNAQYLVIHSNGRKPGGIVINHYTELSHTVKLCCMYDMLLECAKLAQEAGIVAVVEPLNPVKHVGIFLTTTQMAAEMTKLIGSPYLKILYDVYHMQISEGNLCLTIEKYADQFGHVHFADVPNRHEPGEGEICYKKVICALEESVYNGLIGYELFPKDTTAKAVEAIMSL